jgi:transcriptional regulator with XRE-family HTH domain
MKIKVCENIKALRTQRGITQLEFAQILSVTPQSVSRWENGLTYPDIEMLPVIAEYFCVSIDELMGVDGQFTLDRLKNELRDAENLEKKNATAENKLKTCAILEKLAKIKPNPFLPMLFSRMIKLRREGLVDEARVEETRELIREVLHKPADNHFSLLTNIVLNEKDENLEEWHDYITDDYNRCTWDDLLLLRYINYPHQWEKKRQEIAFATISKLLNLLTQDKPCELSERAEKNNCLLINSYEYYKTALDTLNLYSSDPADIFLPLRIIIEFRLAKSLLAEGRKEEGIGILETLREHISLLWNMSDGTVLHGSTAMFDQVTEVVSKSRTVTYIFEILGFNKSPYSDDIRDDERFIEIFSYINSLLPNSRSFITSVNNETLIPFSEDEFKPLLDIAHADMKDAKDKPESLTMAVVLETADGNIYHTVFHDVLDEQETDTFLNTLRKNNNTQVNRIVCMWYDGSIEIPGADFRTKLIRINKRNENAYFLLQGINGYIVQKMSALLPPKQ